jgi:hypothetical protein
MIAMLINCGCIMLMMYNASGVERRGAGERGLDIQMRLMLQEGLVIVDEANS